MLFLLALLAAPPATPAATQVPTPKPTPKLAYMPSAWRDATFDATPPPTPTLPPRQTRTLADVARDLRAKGKPAGGFSSADSDVNVPDAEATAEKMRRYDKEDAKAAKDKEDKDYWTKRLNSLQAEVDAARGDLYEAEHTAIVGGSPSNHQRAVEAQNQRIDAAKARLQQARAALDVAIAEARREGLKATEKPAAPATQ